MNIARPDSDAVATCRADRFRDSAAMGAGWFGNCQGLLDGSVGDAAMLEGVCHTASILTSAEIEINAVSYNPKTDPVAVNEVTGHPVGYPVALQRNFASEGR